MTKLPLNFDGAKFAAKYNLNPLQDFSSDGKENLICPSLPSLTDADLLDCIADPPPNHVQFDKPIKAPAGYFEDIFVASPKINPDRLIFRCSGNRYDHRAITHVDLLERVGRLLAESLEPELRKRETQVIETKAKTEDRSLLDELRAERQRLETAYLRGLFGVERFETLARDLDDRIKNAAGEASGADVRAEQQESLLREIMRTLGSQAKHLPAWLARNDPGETNRILHLLFEKIILHPDGRVELVYK